MRGRLQCDEINGCGTFYDRSLSECPKCQALESFASFVSYDPRDWIYDLETYPNVFTALFKHVATGQFQFFEVSFRKNQCAELVQFLLALKEARSRCIGFNNIGFDYPIIHWIIENYWQRIGVDSIYAKAQQIIDTSWEDRFSNIIWENDRHIEQIDLFKMHHFDNKARRTSLKMLEFNMRSDNIEDLPFAPGTMLTEHDMPTLIKYNWHDVNETEKFYFESLEMIEFREQLGETHGKNFLNHSDKKIGTTLFIDALEKNAPGSCYLRDGGRKIVRQTLRPSIRLADIIFPYIYFNQRGFQLVQQWLQSQTIKKTKGVFEFIQVTPEMAFMMDPKLIKVHGLRVSDVPSMAQQTNIEAKLSKGIKLIDCIGDIQYRHDLNNFRFISGWKDQSGLNIRVQGFQYDFGTGGIHGSIDSQVVESDDEYVIYDWDFGGYYPSLGAANNLYPEHLSNEFGKVDAELKAERAKYKKGTPLNLAIKLARNGAYGDSNNQYSPFFDPQYTMSITINGQLLLCMLAENMITIPGLQMIQINTDGLTVRIPRVHVEHMKAICKWFEQYTCLELESAVYSRMFIRDVNNYIAECEDGKLKRKGAYEYDIEWHKNHSQLVVARAAEAALVRGEDIGEFIRNHDDIHDFMLRSKIDRNEQLEFKDGFAIYELQRITRYYVAKVGGTLTKVSPPAKGYKVGAWKRKTKLTDDFYNSVINELSAMNHSHVDPALLDANGLPWDERINTSNRSKYEIRRTSYQSGRLVMHCNNIADADRNNFDYDYYIEETKKLVEPLRR